MKITTCVLALACLARAGTIPVGQELQMFLDDHVIERTENVTRRVHQAEKRPEPVIRPEHPWERGRTLIFGTAIRDAADGLLKMWYYAGGHVAYATSTDGLAWDKPQLDIAVINGQKTNIVMERGRFGHFHEIFGVLKDARDPDPSRRYKAAFLSLDRKYKGPHMAPFHPGQRRSLGTAVSPDGVHWTMESEFASDEICDISRFSYDTLSDRTVLYGRTKLTPQTVGDRWRLWGWGRAVTRLDSRDFRTWSKGELVLAADTKDPEGTEIYSMSVFPWQGVYVGLVQMHYSAPDRGNLEMQLAISRDGRHFTRVEPRKPFIAEGPVGAWDRFNISLGCLPPVEVGDEWWFYYSGRTYRHSPYTGKDSGPKFGAIGLAKVKRGRLVSLEASFDGGTIVTKPLALAGSTLVLNANAAHGSIAVSLLDEAGKPVPGSEATVRGRDGLDLPVALKAGLLKSLARKPVRIRFALANAQLFGFRVK